MALGAIEAVKARNLKGIAIIGFDALPEALGKVRDGDLTATIEQFPAQAERDRRRYRGRVPQERQEAGAADHAADAGRDHQGQPQRGRAPRRGEVARWRGLEGAPCAARLFLSCPPESASAPAWLTRLRRCSSAPAKLRPSDPQDDRHQQALSRRACARGRASRSRPGRNPRAARRERRRQVDAAEDPVGRAQRRFGQDRALSASRSPSPRPTTRSAPASSPSIRNSPSPPT